MNAYRTVYDSYKVTNRNECLYVGPFTFDSRLIQIHRKISLNAYRTVHNLCFEMNLLRYDFRDFLNLFSLMISFTMNDKMFYICINV